MQVPVLSLDLTPLIYHSFTDLTGGSVDKGIPEEW